MICFQALEELKWFMLKDDKPCVERQKLMRNLKVPFSVE